MKPSKLELQILALLWERGASTAREVLEHMPDGKCRAYTSVLTMLQVMFKKGLVRRTREGVTDRWRPAQPRKKILGNYFGELTAQIFGGNPAAAVQHFLEATNVDDAELAAIERVIREYKRGKR
ncbi:MAG: BlaI/MecI/CopY family transcriptional regulator [Verrucomicrobiales bacterium]|jgi:predicted transcriptional regulator|nr:BlaI/MecI/CopY family transcriptional regulator [Verrucomicrobiales bacterium]